MRIGLTFLIGLAFVGSCEAMVKLPNIYSDGMVLRRNVETTVWGWADEGETVTVSFRGQTVSGAASEGRWQVKLSPMTPGGPWPMTVRGQNEIVLKDVFVGEVWLCSGQSNMVMPLNKIYVGTRTRGGEAAAAKAADPELRFFTVPVTGSARPLDDVSARWLACDPKTAADFSAVAYFFGRDLRATQKVPVGLIVASRGGSPIETWMSPRILAKPEYKSIVGAMTARLNDYARTPTEAHWRASGKPFAPGEYYNGMIAPLRRFAIGGALWYQGESNVGRAKLYESELPDLIADWREAWNVGAFPFLVVQLAPFNKLDGPPAASSAWAEFREAQERITRTTPGTALVVTTDLADGNIHPADKGPVGDRLARAARAIAYGESVAYRGPELDKVERRDADLLIHFRNVGDGLTVKDGELTGFAVAGADRRWGWAKAEIVGPTIVRVACPAAPTGVRYGWADYPVVNLFNRDGLPAVPFRSDNLK